MRIAALFLKKSFILFLGLLLLSGCQTSQKAGVAFGKKIRMPESCEGVQLKIVALEKSVGSTNNVDDVLQLSILYSHQLNSKPNYGKSLELMDNYISKSPKDKLFEFAKYTRSLLEYIQKHKKLLRNQKRLLRNEKEEKKLLIDKITSLKKLDIRLEKHRLGAE